MKKLNYIYLMTSIIVLFFISLDADAKRKKRKDRYYPSKPHNANFLTSCSNSLPTVYNPKISNKMQGGKHTRFNSKANPETVNTIQQAAINGRPVTVAMDYLGKFGQSCNSLDRRCIVLVNVPGLDRAIPQYAAKFPNLPKDSFLAIVEDTGGAFYGKGTGKIDIPMTNGYHRSNAFKSATFEVLTNVNRGGRHKDYTHFRPFIGGREAKCSVGPDRGRSRARQSVDSDNVAS